MRARGFTLMELAIAMAMAGVIALAATAVYVPIAQTMRSNQARARLTEQSRAVLDYVLEEAARSGGGTVPTRASIIVEDDCGARDGFPTCHGSDRVTVLQPILGYRTCRVVATAGDIVDVNLGGATPADCCLKDDTTNGSFKRHVLMTLEEGGAPFDLPVMMTLQDAGACRFKYQPLVPPAAMSHPAVRANWDNASLQLVDVKTFYVEYVVEPASRVSPSGTLVMHTELDGNLSSLGGERLDIAKDVFDFQVALGFRGGGGRVAVERADRPESDDWAFNDSRGDAGFNYDQLVMVGASVLVGMRDPVKEPHVMSTLWGEARSIPARMRVMPAAGRVALRALGVAPSPPAGP